MELLSSKVKDSMHFVEYNINANNNPNNKMPHTVLERRTYIKI